MATSPVPTCLSSDDLERIKLDNEFTIATSQMNNTILKSDELYIKQLISEELEIYNTNKLKLVEQEKLDSFKANELNTYLFYEDEINRAKLQEVALKDKELAERLQKVEDQLSIKKQLHDKEDAIRKKKVQDWIEPIVNCLEDTNNSIKLAIELPNLGTTDIKIKRNNDSFSVVSINAFSSDKSKQFQFDMNLRSDSNIVICKDNIKVDYSNETSVLTVRVIGILLNKEKELSVVDKLSNVFSFFIPSSK